MIKEKLKGSGQNIIKNKNFLNNQNYVSNNNVKNILLYDYHFGKNNSFLVVGIIGICIKKIILFGVNGFYKNHNNLKYYYLIHILFGLLCLPLFLISVYLYFGILLFVTFWFSNFVNDFYNSTVYILRIKNSIGNKFFKYSYISRLIEYIGFSESVFNNNVQIFLLSLLSSTITTGFFYFILNYFL